MFPDWRNAAESFVSQCLFNLELWPICPAPTTPTWIPSSSDMFSVSHPTISYPKPRKQQLAATQYGIKTRNTNVYHLLGVVHTQRIRFDCINCRKKQPFLPVRVHESKCICWCWCAFIIVTQGRCSRVPPPHPPALLRAAVKRTVTQTWCSASTDPPPPPNRLLVGFQIFF